MNEELIEYLRKNLRIEIVNEILPKGGKVINQLTIGAKIFLKDEESGEDLLVSEDSKSVGLSVIFW